MQQEKIFRHKRELEKIKGELLKNASKSTVYDILRRYYAYLKLASADFFDVEKGIDLEYKLMINELQRLEHIFLPNDTIIKLPTYNLKSEIEKPALASSHEEILNYIVHKTRLFIFDNLYGEAKKTFDRISRPIASPNATIKLERLPLEAHDLTGQCYDASWFTYDLCESLSIKSKVITIEPGYVLCSQLFGGGGGHCFTVITLEDKKYLVDCTYSQFFQNKKCLEEKIGVMLSTGCSAGLFMTMEPNRKKVAEKILMDGWIELDDEVLKNYLDGFTLSYRNGLYYEKTEDFSCTTPYTIDDYREFLAFGGDSQIEHEGREVLGYQYRPLKDPNMKIHF